jgi:prevent-host-death family protein
MAEVTVRELRNQGAEVLDRVAAGEHLTVTRDGRPIAELRPFPRPRLRAEELLHRWSLLPYVDPQVLRDDIDRVVEASV